MQAGGMQAEGLPCSLRSRHSELKAAFESLHNVLHVQRDEGLCTASTQTTAEPRRVSLVAIPDPLHSLLQLLCRADDPLLPCLRSWQRRAGLFPWSVAAMVEQLRDSAALACGSSSSSTPGTSCGITWIQAHSCCSNVTCLLAFSLPLSPLAPDAVGGGASLSFASSLGYAQTAVQRQYKGSSCTEVAMSSCLCHRCHNANVTAPTLHTAAAPSATWRFLPKSITTGACGVFTDLDD